MTAGIRPRIRLLGPIEVDGADAEDSVPAGQPRMVLAYLALHRGSSVPTRRLVEEMWGGAPPASADTIIHSAVSKIRRALGSGAVQRTAGGYLLQVEEIDIDVGLVENLRASARTYTAVGDERAAVAALNRARRCWRGEPLADAGNEPFVPRARDDLIALRRRVVTEWAVVSLAANSSDSDVVEQLAELVRDDPLDECAQALLIQALAQAGNRAEALRRYDLARQALSRELGVDPGAQLQAVYQTLVASGAEHGRKPLAVPTLAQPRVPARQNRRRWLAAIGAVAGVAATLLVVSHMATGGSRPSGTRASSSTTLAAPNRSSPAAPLAAYPAPISTTIDLPEPSCCAVTPEGTWGAGHHDDTLHLFSTDTGRSLADYPVVGFQAGVPLAAAGSIWVGSAAGDLVRFDPATRRVQARIATGGGVQLAFGFLKMWATTRNHQLLAVDLRTNRVVGRRSYAAGANNWDDAITVGPNAIWVADPDNNTLLRLAPHTLRVVARIHGFGHDDAGMPLIWADGSVWLKRIMDGHEYVFQIDPTNDRIVSRVVVAAAGASGLTGSITTGGGYIWSGNWDDTVAQIDPTDHRVVQEYKLPELPQNLTYTGGALWVDGYDAGQAWRISTR